MLVWYVCICMVIKLYVCSYVWVCVVWHGVLCVYVCVHICICMFAIACVHAYVCACVCVWLQPLHINLMTSSYISNIMHMHLHTSWVRTHAHTHAHSHTRTCTRTHTHTHTHTQVHFVHYPTRDLQRRLGVLKQWVTIFAITWILIKKHWHGYASCTIICMSGI